MPKRIGANDVARLALKSDMIRQSYKEYIQEFCGPGGGQPSNLSKKERSGLERLKKKVKENSIVICCTDKSGK